jgi:hypothetical protein
MKLDRQPLIPWAELKRGIAECFAQGRELLESAALLAERRLALGASSSPMADSAVRVGERSFLRS